MANILKVINKKQNERKETKQTGEEKTKTKNPFKTKRYL